MKSHLAITRLRPKLVGLCVLVLLGICSLIGIFLQGSACSILQGTCQYDPRSQHPMSLFISQPPERAVVQYINDKIKLGGTFPVTATAQVASVEPIWVSAGGFYTDWHVQADVSLRILYTNGDQREAEFELFEKSGGPILGIEKTTMFVGFGPLQECDQGYTGIWHCR